MTSRSLKSPKGFREFTSGVRSTLPLVVGAIPFAVVFGTLASAGGLSLQGTMAMSLFVFAGSAQFIALGLIAAGTAWPMIVVTTFVINLRHLLYAATLIPYVSKLPHFTRLVWAFALTDEAFAVAMSRVREPGMSLTPGYYFGSASFMYVSWQLCTFVGFAAGRHFPVIAEWGLDFAMPVTFIGMLMPYLTTRPMVCTVMVAGISALVLHSLPHKIGLIAASLLGVLTGLCLETWKELKSYAE